MRKSFWLLGICLIALAICGPTLSYADLIRPGQSSAGHKSPRRRRPGNRKKANSQAYSVEITLCDENGNCPEDEGLLPEPATAPAVKSPKQTPVKKKTKVVKSVKKQPVKAVQTATPKQPAKPYTFEILPTLDTPSTATNQAWAGTFQLVWNDFANELLKEPVTFINGNPPMADFLNKQSFSVNELAESAYYKAWGPTSPELKQTIEQGIKEKFNETSDVLDKGEWKPGPLNYTLYAMLKKDFEYVAAFKKLLPGPFAGSQEKVKYFGLGEAQSKDSVRVLFYHNRNDFAVTLLSKAGDKVHLYRTDKEGTLDELYRQMESAAKVYKGIHNLSTTDQFKAPVIEFNNEREFKELYNQDIHVPGQDLPFQIALALETIQFKMDETGVKLKSEAILQTRKATANRPSNPPTPRYFNVTGRYAIFAEEDGKAPYFAMLVTDAAKLQK